MNQASSTKSKICSAAILLFSDKGYNNSGIRELAAAVGIRSSSIYKHFASKEAILNHIFLQFEVFLATKRYRVEEILHIAGTEPLIEAYSKCFRFPDLEKGSLMMRILIIILSLRYQNELADKTYRDIFCIEYPNYQKQVTDGLRKMGKIKDIDYTWINYMICSSIIMKLQDLLTQGKTYDTIREQFVNAIYAASSFFVETYSS